MAVTVISSPPVQPILNSASYPMIIQMSSDVYGTAGVTQHRFKCQFLGGFTLPTKFTIVSIEPNIGIFDISSTLRSVLPISRLSGTDPPFDITKTNTDMGLKYPWAEGVLVLISEEYFLNGSPVENPGPQISLTFARGIADLAGSYPYYDHINPFPSWYKYNGRSDFMPYSGHARIVYGFNTHDLNYVPYTTNGNIGWVMSFDPDVATYEFWSGRGSVPNIRFLSLYRGGKSDTEDFIRCKIQVYTNVTQSLAGSTLEETIYIDKNVTICEDPEVVIMFADRFNSWSFMSFTKKHRTTVNTTSLLGELVPEGEPPGRFKYGLDGSDSLALNTDWMNEDKNELWRDLIQTEQSYIVNADGSLDPVTIVPNSLRLKTSRTDGPIQYSMTVRKSLDNFKV